MHLFRGFTFLIVIAAFWAQFHVARAANYLDSLENRLNYAPPVDKIAILNQLASSSISVSPERSLDYARKAYELSVANSYLKGKADALNNLGTFYESRGEFDKALEYHKQCLALRIELKDPNDIAQSYNNLGIVYYGMNNFSSAYENYQKSLQLREESGNKKEIAKSLNNIGVLFLKWKKLDQALSA
jgi:tetratricopeptide (TPR) repeat protein